MKNCNTCHFLGITEAMKQRAEDRNINVAYFDYGYCRNPTQQGYKYKSDICDNHKPIQK